MFARKAHMTAQTTGALPWPDQGSRAARRVVRPVAGVLADGTPYYVPIGEIVSDGTTVVCHLCGRSLKSVAAHLRAHGWAKTAYCETFGLERGQPLESCPGMRPGPALAAHCPSSVVARLPGRRPPPPVRRRHRPTGNVPPGT